MSDTIKELVHEEPWRVGQGRPRNILDMSWDPNSWVVCDGEVVWDKDGVWWYCPKCGHCSRWSQTLHYRAEHPQDSYNRNIQFFYKRRKEQGVSDEVAKLQALHIAGLALKAAAMLPPGELAKFINERLMVE